mgnify:CR=1 FL=1
MLRLCKTFSVRVVNVKKKPNDLAKIGNKARYVNKSASPNGTCTFLMEEEYFCFPEGNLGHSFYALFFSFSLVKRKIGIKRIRVPKADFKLVSIIGVPNRT